MFITALRPFTTWLSITFSLHLLPQPFLTLPQQPSGHPAISSNTSGTSVSGADIHTPHFFTFPIYK